MLLVLFVLALLYAAACLYLAQKSPPVAFTPEELAAPVGPLPASFLLGTATAAHQIEGGNDKNDWWRFEEKPGAIKNGDRSGRAADHWSRVPGDIALMKSLGANAYRFSIEWSRVEPEKARYDEAAWAHYEDEVKQLKAAGITPMVTLLHFTLPAWLADEGGVTAPDFPARFGAFAAEAARRLGGDVDLWCTLNEPNVQMFFGYVEGTWPPGEKSNELAARAFAGLLRGHAAAAKAIRGQDPAAKIGVAMHLQVFDPLYRVSLLDWIIARASASAFNWAFYDSIQAGRVRFSAPGFPSLDEPADDLKSSADFFGVNYYRRELVHFSPGAVGMVARQPGPNPTTDMGWEIYPEGLLRVIREAHGRYGLPIYVTESGVSDIAGTQRPAYLRGHLRAVVRALQEGIPVEGFFYWSLMDNFEWAEGFTPRFGLYRVDYATQERAPAPGAEVFREAAQALGTLAP
jgi:beta-glucosidase